MSKITNGDGDSVSEALDQLGDKFVATGRSGITVGAGLILADGVLPVGDILGVPTFFAGTSLGALGILFQMAGELIGDFEEQACACPPSPPPSEEDLPDLTSIDLQEMFDPDDLFGDDLPAPDFGLDGVPVSFNSNASRIGGSKTLTATTCINGECAEQEMVGPEGLGRAGRQATRHGPRRRCQQVWRDPASQVGR